ncbi:MAG TPA: glutamine-hydrolyzing GMP synthase [Candidatus Nanoarchaeia archaeon]
MIAIIDFGSQYTHLISRRLRQLGTRAEIFPPGMRLSQIAFIKGIILSGGPASVYDRKSLKTPVSNLKNDKPILGICYGHQYLAKFLGGEVEVGTTHEYGRETIEIANCSPLFASLNKHQKVWLSHGDQVTKLPAGFKKIASSKNCEFAAYENGQIFGLQFHPEVVHTENGIKILENFIGICSEERNWQLENQIAKIVDEVKTIVGKDKVLIAVSGGVDSLVAATLIHNAIGRQLHPVFVDSGLLRKNEAGEVRELFKRLKFYNFHFVDASKLFLGRLKGVVDPEKKRRLIGKTFIEVFTKEGERLGKKEKIRFLAQGTIYPDRIESAAASQQAEKIKSHHNLIIPKGTKFKVIEPLAEFYKDEVREIGQALGLPLDRLWRHPFPGPGLAVRILGEVTKKQLAVLREADAIFIDELQKSRLYDQIWQAFAVLLPVKSVGVMGDARTYEYLVSLRAVTSVDGMTADWFKMPHEVLEKISSRIVNEVAGVNRVVYDITQKPPATIEYE